MPDAKDFFKEYCKFVDSVTCEDSANDQSGFERMHMLSDQLGGHYARFDNAMAGLAGEAGECADLWKKLKYHRKDFNEETRQKIIDELGDICWYVANASIALGVDMDDIIRRNVEKLHARHPHGYSPEYLEKK